MGVKAINRKIKVTLDKNEHDVIDFKYIVHEKLKKGDIIGDYQIEQSLKNNSKNGAVYKATYVTQPNEEVVIKRMENTKKEESQILDILKISADKKDSHNIVEIKDIFQSEDTEPYLVMESCTHGDFYDFLKQTTKEKFILEEEIARLYFMQMVEAVTWMHHLDVVHLDLKLENFLVTESDEGIHLKLADFDTSYYLDSEKTKNFEETVRRTTRNYQAPETFHPANYPKKWDVWSLGVILHILLYGGHPYNLQADNDRPYDYYYQQSKGYLHGTSDVSDEARNIIEQMLEYDESKRIDSMDILQHPWIQTGDKDKKLERLHQQFKAKEKELSEKTNEVSKKENELSQQDTDTNVLKTFWCWISKKCGSCKCTEENIKIKVYRIPIYS